MRVLGCVVEFSSYGRMGNVYAPAVTIQIAAGDPRQGRFSIGQKRRQIDDKRCKGKRGRMRRHHTNERFLGKRNIWDAPWTKNRAGR